jgi:hypothetical protein
MCEVTDARVRREACLVNMVIWSGVGAGMDEVGEDAMSGRVMVGVLGLVEAVMTISRRRGIPRVTLAAPCPTKGISTMVKI